MLNAVKTAWKKLTTSESQEVAELKKLLAENTEVMNKASDVILHYQNMVGGLNASIAFLQEKLNEVDSKGLFTIACLLSASGGSVFLSREIISALDEMESDVKSEETEDGLTLKLIVKEPAYEEDEDECD